MSTTAQTQQLKHIGTHPMAAYLNSLGCALIAWSILAWGSNLMAWLAMKIGSVSPLFTWEKISVEEQSNWSWRLVVLVVGFLFLFYALVFLTGLESYTNFKRENSIRRLLGTWLQWSGIAWAAGFLFSGIFPRSEMNAIYLWVGGGPPWRMGIGLSAVALACMFSKPMIYAFLRNSGSISAIKTPKKAAGFLLKYVGIPLLALLLLSLSLWKGDLGDSFVLMVLVQMVMLLWMLLWLFIHRPQTTKYKIYLPSAFTRIQLKLLIWAGVFLISLLLPFLGIVG